jgi:CBS domain-containing protein
MDIGLNLNVEAIQEAEDHPPLCVDPGASVRGTLELLKVQGEGSVLICRDGRLAGIFTERDALRMLAGGDDLDVPVGQVMTRDPVTLRPGDTLATAISLMSTNGYRRLPVVDSEGRPLGMVMAAGIVHWLVEHFPKAVYNLPPVSNPATREREGP